MIWTLALLPYLSFLRLDLHLSDQLISAQFFISYLILIISWGLSGPIMAAILSFLMSAVSMYLFLMTKEPAYFLQLAFYAVFYVVMVFYLLNVQRKTNDKQILREKLIEDTRWVQADIVKSGVLKVALERKIDRFLSLRRFSEELKEIQDIESAAQSIVREVCAALGKAEECSLYLVDEDRQDLSLMASRPAGGGAMNEKGSLFDQWVMRKSKGLMIEDSQSDFRFASDRKKEWRHMRSVCVSPLMTGNKVLGVLRVNTSEPAAFNADDLRLLDIFANLGSVTLKNILLYAKVQEMATHDGLTGLHLNRYFQLKLAEKCQRAQQEQKPFSLLLADIDHFKRYNDDYGHSAGDLVLKNTASIILKCLEPWDLAARYGGEEFLVLLPDKNKKEAKKVAEKLRMAIKANPFTFRRIEAHVTASFGVSAYPEDGSTQEALLRMADKYLYRSKQLGRNRVCGNL